MRDILRSMIFVPGFRAEFLKKAKHFRSDALILDLEDSVPDAFKDEARKNISEYVKSGDHAQKIFIRLNSIESGYLSRDLDCVLDTGVFGFMPTMIQDDLDIVYIDKLLSQLEHARGISPGFFKLCPLIETGSALLKALEIAKASPRMVGLAFGAEDYLTDLDGLHKESGTSILVARSMIVMAARSQRIAALDTPFLNVSNLDAFQNEVEFARELGFSGQLVLHPSQIDIVNRVFTPSENEVEEARRIIAAIDASGREGHGVTLLDGKLIGPPMEKRARKVVEKWENIKASEWKD